MIRLAKKTFSSFFQRTRRKPVAHPLHSVERMQAIIERERVRSDRGGSKFALLVFTLPTRGSQELDALARVLEHRIRVTDDAGLLDAHRVGVVLPETPVSGAWKLSADVCELLPSDLRRPECQVYVYPTPPSPTVEPKRPHPVEVQSGDERRRGRPMEVLFMQELPAWKRMIDVVGAGTALLIASPVLLAVAVAIKLTSKGPIFFAQQRDGLGGRTFRIYKFRSMIVDAEAMKDKLRAVSEQDGPAFKLKNDPRVTPLGRFLRRTCLDEIPQLFNVLRGDMSLVGPRPLPSNEARDCRGWERRRFDVTPGLTCIWQVYGGTKVSFAEWMRMDLRYAGSRTLWKDLRLMVMTVPSIIRRDGVY
jgi:lipopolysaccharide/colanic/teichoic acid biosynthesis glycosyltransferase